jgi:ParB family chromosome partitioning protein
MSLKKKAAQINLGMLVAGAVANSGQSVNPLNQAPSTSKSGMTAIGMHAETVYKDRKISAENDALKAELAGWAGATPAQKLDPKLVKPSKWANRDERSFQGKAWAAFTNEILSSGGNVQPIKVRGVLRENTSQSVTPLEGVLLENTLLPAYEIVFGHRRHRACLELGIPVFALVEAATDQELFAAMDRENRQRADLTVYEQGEMYRRALDDGLYPSLRKLAESLGVHVGNASESIRIAKLPEPVLDAFESRLDIQRRWAVPIAEAVQKDPDYVFALAKAIEIERAQGQVVKSADVFKRFTTTAGLPAAALVKRYVPLTGRAKLQVTRVGSKYKFELDLLDAAMADRVEAAIIQVMKS